MRAYLLLPALFLLGGCNWVMNVSGLAADANKAIGAACRQTGRSLEVCYARNPEADKAQIYGGWREMHEYMVKNKLETMEPPPDPLPETSAPVVAGAEKTASDAAQKKNEHAVSAAGSASAAQGKRPLTSAEADELAKTDPQVEAILSSMRKGSGAKPKSNGPSEDEQRLLKLINEASPTAKEDSFGKPAAAIKK